MVCENPRQKSLIINRRGTFFGDPFFRDSWADYNSAVRRIVNRFNDGWINPSQRIRDSQYHSMYRALRSARQNYSTHSARFREEADCYKLVMDVHEFVGGDITVRTAGKTVSVRGKVETDSGRVATLRTEKGKQEENSDISSSGKLSASSTLHRRYNLPSDADCDKIESALSKDAVLTVTIPKRTDVRYIPLDIECKKDSRQLSEDILEDDRNGSVKRPHDSPLLSSRKKLQEDQNLRADFPPWRRQYSQVEANKENSSAKLENVSTRRSRFEKFLINSSVDDPKEENEQRQDKINRQIDKYEDAREVTIPITFSDQGQDKIFKLTKENKDKCAISSTKKSLPSIMIEKSIGTQNSSLNGPLIQKKTKPTVSEIYGAQKSVADILIYDKTNNKAKIADKINGQDENVAQKSIPQTPKFGKINDDQNNISRRKCAGKKSKDMNAQWQKSQTSKRGRSMDGIASQTRLEKFPGRKFHDKDNPNENSAKSPKLIIEDHLIPHLSLCKPESPDNLEMLINEEDNLKSDIYSKLDTLDTPKTGQKNKSPSVTPGGREIIVEKGQSLMEDDIFQDCWSDFSNTLQEVLNRLQELSSELGQSKVLANSLTDSEIRIIEQPSVPGNLEPVDSEMKKSSMTNATTSGDEYEFIKDESDKFDYQKLVVNSKLTTNAKEIDSMNEGLLTEENNIPPYMSDELFIVEAQGDNAHLTNKNNSVSTCSNINNDVLVETILKPSTSQKCHINGSSDSEQHLSEKSKNSFIKQQSSIDSCDSSSNPQLSPAFTFEPVLESKVIFSPEFDSQTSISVHVLQPQTSVGLVSKKDLSSAAVPQSSSVCLTDNTTLGIPSDADPCDKFRPRLYIKQDSSNANNNSNAVMNDINECELVQSYDNLSKNESTIAVNIDKTTIDASVNNTLLYDSLTDIKSRFAKYFEKNKQAAQDKMNDCEQNSETRALSETSAADCQTINTEKSNIATLISSTNNNREDINILIFPTETKGEDYYYPPHDTNNILLETDASYDCSGSVDNLGDDVMRRAAFFQNGVNSPRGKSSHLSSAKLGVRRFADLQKEKKICQPQEHCYANQNFTDMGSLLTRGRDSHKEVTPPVFSENISPLKYNYRKQSTEEITPVPPYVRQKSQPSKRFTGFANVNSNNVRRMRDALSTKPENEDSEPNILSPSPTSRESYHASSADNKAKRRSPSPMRSPLSTKDEPYSSFRRSSLSRHRQSFSPSSGDTDCLMNSRDPYKKSSQKSSYFSPTFSSSQKTCGSGNSKKSNGSYYCSSQDQKQFAKNSRKCTSPILSPKNEYKENDDGFSNTKIGEVPERKRQSENSWFKPKHEPSYSPRTHQRIFKRFRNANLQPDSEAICFIEEEEKYKMVLDVEKFVPGEIEVLQDESMLTVKGKVERKDGLHVSVRTFNRTFCIPRNSREEDIDSSLSEDGILTIFVPKKKERIIKIELID